MNYKNGFSMIELLVSLLLISIFLLCWDNFSLVALRENRNAYLQNLAENQIYSLSEELHGMQNSEEAANKLITWNKQNQQILPEGKGLICGEFPHYTITLFWGVKTNKCNCNDIKIGDKLKCLTVQL